MKRAIITGATGFVGANLARRLIRAGHEVHLLVRSGCNPWRIEAIRGLVRLHEVDLGDEAALAARVGEVRPDWVFHLAAHGAYSSQTDFQQMVATNIIGTRNLLLACLRAGFEAFVNAGTSSEYGFKGHAPSETDWLEPNSDYAVTKASATLWCRHIALAHGAHVVTLRLYSVFGPYEEPTRLLPTVMLSGMEGRFCPLVSPDTARDFVFVDDVSEACILAATRPGPAPGAVYNVGTGTQTTLRQVVEVVREVFSVPGEPKWGSMLGRSWDTKVWVADAQKIGKELGWSPGHTFRQGFEKTIEWFRGHPDMLRFYRARLLR